MQPGHPLVRAALFCQADSLWTRHAEQTRARLRALLVRSRHDQTVGESVKVYTTEEVADFLKVDYKTVLRLIKRGLLKAISGCPCCQVG